ncbi:helix-turn-helix domain-containing protein [Roseovarius sp. EL26]|uniref:helix-turn-helix domain-containing protein n=1 Tax=Roseovarius sp. EL26 TaxID=2126672 RepID=UPI000EA3D337|nr:helix-turn-helix transcriptional regulator [Roseovarius sp. EL26]
MRVSRIPDCHCVFFRFGRPARARKSQNLSQAALAERLRCHQSFVARIESGQRRIDVPELVIIARALDVPAEHFFEAVIKAVPPGERI